MSESIACLHSDSSPTTPIHFRCDGAKLLNGRSNQSRSRLMNSDRVKIGSLRIAATVSDARSARKRQRRDEVEDGADHDDERHADRVHVVAQESREPRRERRPAVVLRVECADEGRAAHKEDQSQVCKLDCDEMKVVWREVFQERIRAE
jgi:hypothetical protein